MRISDWSSDVCSSDLMAQRRRDPQGAKTRKPESKRGGTRRCRPHTTRCRAVGLEGELQAAGDCDDVVVVVADLFRTDEAGDEDGHARGQVVRSEEHTSELQSPKPIPYADFCMQTKPTIR